MPLHYMLSEIVICAVALWGALRLWLNRRTLGSIGVMFFGLAALIGIIRIASGADEILAPAHRFASQAGGAFGLVLIVSEVIRLRAWRVPLPAVVTSAGVAALAVVTGGAWGGMVFFVLLLTGALLIATHSGRKLRGLLAMGFAIMAPNILFVRQSPFLGTDASWHAYHLFTALWLVAVIAGLQSAQTEVPKRASSA
jgi:hypothetical protein